MLRSKYLVGLILVTTLMATLIPFSALVYAQNSEGIRAEKFVELAERAGEKVDNFLKIIYANDTAIDTITDAKLYGKLDANKTLFETWGLGNLSEAQAALEAVPPDYPGAIANATEALSIFREVFKAVNTILAEAGVERGQLIDAQGLIEAMKRALDRIERIKEMGPSAEVLKILNSAKEYLNVDEAIKWLMEGRVNETAWNLTQANRLISLAHSMLKKKAGELNVKRIENYLKVIDNFYDRLERLAEKAGATDLLSRLTKVKPIIVGAKTDLEATPPNVAGAIEKLTDARNMLEDIQRDLLELRRSGHGD